MTRGFAIFAFLGILVFSSCAKKEAGEPSTPAAEAPATAESAGGPHVFVQLKDGTSVPGTIVASSATDMIVAGDDGVEHKIPLDQIKTVEYREAQAAKATRQATAKRKAREASAPAQEHTQQAAQAPTPASQAPAAVTTRTYELPSGSEISVRVNENIDSGTANEGQTFEAEITRDAKDANGDVVIPRRSPARIVIKSASKGGRFRGASDLVLDMQSVTINGKQYVIDTAEIGQKGRSGVGANKRTATFTGGGAALGAIIGAIAGGGKGAAIGAGAGAGAGVLTQVFTKGGAIKVPTETVLTFTLDKPLRVTAVD